MLTPSKYAYKVESTAPGRNITPCSFVNTPYAVETAKEEHSRELPGCSHVVTCLHQHDFELTWPNDPCEYTCKICGHKELN